jgi:hypothetical protein
MNEVQAKARELARGIYGQGHNAVFVGPNSIKEGPVRWAVVSSDGYRDLRAHLVDLDVLGIDKQALLLAAFVEELSRKFASIQIFGSADSLSEAIDAHPSPQHISPCVASAEQEGLTDAAI